MELFTISRSKYLQLSYYPDTLVSVAEKVIIKSTPSTALIDVELPENGEQFEFKAVLHSDKSV